MSPDRLRAAYQTAKAALLAERTPDGHWVGELSTSALSTAVAVGALSLAGVRRDLVDGGLRWLTANQNADGGWGDTVKSFSNISTTMLCRAAFHLAGAAAAHVEPLKRADAWLGERYGTTPAEHAEAVRQRYGKDRTFSVPILMTCALAGLVEWREVPALPFELACLPQSWYRFARLPVVSYALPALIAIGQAIYHHRPPRNPLTRATRRLAIQRSLKVLERIQPSSGGYLEAIPLTSFVVMSLASVGASGPAQRVISNGVAFIERSVRPDGSWPIDSNLATWVTTLAVNALATAGDLDALDRNDEVRDWLLRQQFKERHPFTGADPGGWGWTDLPGSVPDADDTPGAMLALVKLNHPDVPNRPPTGTEEHGVWARQIYGLRSCEWWLRRLQNRDGGWPTFCRGWGKLPFDRSGTDLTAHALRAIRAWDQRLREADDQLFEWFLEWYRGGPFRADNVKYKWGFAKRALDYLARQQRPDGSWLPLWFGNQHAPDDENPTYGTARVLAAYRDLGLMDQEPARRGVAWLLANQNDDGGWGGCRGTPSSVEETALAVEVLLDVTEDPHPHPLSRKAGRGEQIGPPSPGFAGEGMGVRVLHPATQRGLAWLVAAVEAGALMNPSPIGFYFAKLWYFERLYPIIFSVAALGRACRRQSD